MDCQGHDNEASNEISQLTVQLLDRRYNRAVDALPSPTGSIKAAQIPATCLDNIRELLRHYPNGIPSLKLEREYSNLYKSKLDIEEWGYENLSHMLQLNSDLFLLKKVDNETLKKYPEYIDDFLVFYIEDNTAHLQEVDYDLKIKLVRLILKFSAEKITFPIYRWIEFYRQEYNVPNFTFDLLDHVTLFKIITKEFPIELYISDDPPLTGTASISTNSEPTTEQQQSKNVLAIDTVEAQQQVKNVLVNDTANERHEQVNNVVLDNGAAGFVAKIDSIDGVSAKEHTNVISANDSTMDIDVAPESQEIEESYCSGDLTHTTSELTMTDETSERGVRLDHGWVNLNDPVQPLVSQDSRSNESVKTQIYEKSPRAIIGFNQTICARARPQKQIFRWRAKMVKEGKHQLVLDLCLQADKIPPDVCKPGDFFMPINLNLPNNTLSKANIHQVTIVATSNPNHLFVNLMQSGEQLREMAKDMSESFLRADLSSYIVPKDLLYEGFPCLVQSIDDKTNEKVWERSKIHQCDSKTATVESVDFGGFKTVDLNEVYLIPKKWTALPAQALHVSLIGLKPRADTMRWTSDAKLRITDFSWPDYGLDCLFLNEKKNSQHISYEVILCDRHDPDMSIFLDKVLLVEGLADPDTSRSQEIEQWRDLML